MRFRGRLLALAAAAVLVLGFAGCAIPPAQDTDSGGTTRAVVDERETADYIFSPESPSVHAAVTLPGGGEVVQTAAVPTTAGREMRAVWISYLEMAHLLTGKTEAQFTQGIQKAFDNVKTFGLNTVIVHVRPFGDALYDSDYFPWSYVITGTEGKNPGFDPLAIMVREAKSRGLQIEAWLNPYRVRAQGNEKAMSADNPARKWLEAGSGAVRQYGGATSYNPASPAARQLIADGAAEIVRKYDVDGIHIDDYFYPTTDAAYDRNAYASYQSGGGGLSLADWRRQNVEALVKAMYAAVKKEDPGVRFGISPQSSVYNNYNAQYLDVEKIASTPGYCDYICPQIYFGYQNDAQPYLKTLNAWNEMVRNSDVELYVGLAVYKVGLGDSWAGSGQHEWSSNTDLLSRMVADARTADQCTGFVLYRYDSIFHPDTAVQTAVQAECGNLRALL